MSQSGNSRLLHIAVCSPQVTLKKSVHNWMLKDFTILFWLLILNWTSLTKLGEIVLIIRPYKRINIIITSFFFTVYHKVRQLYTDIRLSIFLESINQPHKFVMVNSRYAKLQVLLIIQDAR